MFALVVVLPTPPLPEVTTTTLDTFDKGCLLDTVCLVPFNGRSDADAKFFVRRVCVIRGALIRHSPSSRKTCAARPRSSARDLVGHDVGAGDRHQLGLQLLAEDARARQPRRAGHRAAAQRRVDVEVAVGDHLRARVHRRQDDEIVVARVDDLAAAHRLASPPSAR